MVVVRLVYDGPPAAGKTTSLRALGANLGRDVHTPAESEGRTLFFDWMDYTGGCFEGYKIRCQLVSVPGQKELATRRLHLLREADAIVLVADTSPEGLDGTRAALRDLPAVLRTLPTPQAGIVLQANKRDDPGAISIEQLRGHALAAGLQLTIVESTASQGSGVREAFVLAVRLALDRVRELLRTDQMPEGSPEIADPDALLHAMKGEERAAELASRPAMLAKQTPPRLSNAQSNLGSVASAVLARVLEENEAAANSLRGVHAEASDPLPPDASAPSGSIWPPVLGRALLQEATRAGMRPRRQADGGWVASVGTAWKTHSAADAWFEEFETARTALHEWVRLHVANADVLSPRRCLAMAPTGNGGWRLWQIVAQQASLRAHVQEAKEGLTDTIVASLLAATTGFLDVAEHRRASVAFPCTIDTIGIGCDGAHYCGLVPRESAASAQTRTALGSEVRRLLTTIPLRRRAEIRAALCKELLRNKHSIDRRGRSAGGHGEALRLLLED